MDARTLAILAASGVCLAAPAVAEQGASPVAAKAPQVKPQEVMTLKPAELEVQLAERAEAKPPVAAPKRRAARVTTCRCGDLASQQ